MADTGLLDLGALMQQLGPSEDEKRMARAQAAIMAGLGMIGARKGYEAQDISRAALGGMLDYNQQMRDVPQEKLHRVAAAQQLMQMQEMQRKLADQDAARKIAMQYGQGAMPGQAPQQMPAPEPAPSQPPPAPSFNFQNIPAADRAAVMADVQNPRPWTPESAVGVPQPQAMPPQQTAGQQQSPKRAQAQYYEGLAQKYQAAGLVDQAQAAHEAAIKSLPAIKETRTLTQNGKRVTVNIYNDGSYEILPLGPDAEKAHFLDTGAKVGAVDPFTGQPIAGGGLYNKDVTPGESLSAQTTMRGQNMTDARARELNAINAGAGQILETPNGYVRVGKDNTATPILAGGAQLQPKPTGAIVQQVAQNNVTLNKIDRALEWVDKTPNAFGLKNVMGDQVMQRFDPSGVAARAMVADIAGQKIHDRSGAAVTVGEAERLKPYVPNVTDTPDVVKKKLGMFKREYQQMQSELAGGRSIASVAYSGNSGASGGWSIQEVK